MGNTLFSDLQVLLQQIQLVEGVQDEVCWRFHSSGCFSVRGFQDEYYKGIDHSQQHNKEINKVWRKVAPPKAELFLWLVMQGRINTKVRLQSLNLLPNSDTRCVFCKNVDEDLSHLLFNCTHVWKFWYCCCNTWGLSWVMSNDPNINFDSWITAPFKGGNRKRWILCFYVITWSIWKHRNDIIFKASNIPWKKL